MSNLTKQIDSLLELDDKGALSPHGIGGLARELLKKCKAELNTRTVPDVPELVRHDFSPNGMVQDCEGYHTPYNQAAAIIAAKDAEIASWKHVAEKAIEGEIKSLDKLRAAKAKLAQIEKQEAICWRWRPKGGSVWFYDPKIEWLDEQDVALIDKEPVYTAPVASDAELRADAERYRYLRSRDVETIRKGGVFAGVTPENYVINGIDLDYAIDAALNPSEPRT